MTLSFDFARRMLDALDQPALLIEGQRTRLANRAARALLGSRIEGQDVRLALRHPDALELLLSGREGNVELVGVGGEERAWRLLVAPLGHGQLLARLEDLSLARSAERMRVDFVANASHELRTPLATVIGYAETLAEDGDLDPALRRRFATTIAREAARMTGLIEELMSLSRIAADRYRAPSDVVDLAQLVREVADECSELARRHGGEIELALEDGLPAISGDRGQLAQLLTNLIGNALRYGCGPTSKRVVVSVARHGADLRLTVRDFGEGIAAQHLPRLTERFYRVDPARSRDGGGTGLGLAIVKHIVERHRGTLAIRSTPSQGTEVLVTLPAENPLS
jgi:two-component system phosphate regulon sensor histidine kinase PhoR